MRAEAGRHQVERGVVEREVLHGRLAGADVRESLLARRLRDHGEHVGRQIARYHLASVRREAIGHVAAPAPEVYRAPRARLGGDRLQRVEVGAGGMQGAGDVQGGARAELRLGDGVVASAHEHLRTIRGRPTKP